VPCTSGKNGCVRRFPVAIHRKGRYDMIKDLKLGILINFNVPMLRNGIKRIVNSL
jgi:hypothetical protein